MRYSISLSGRDGSSGLLTSEAGEYFLSMERGEPGDNWLAGLSVQCHAEVSRTVSKPVGKGFWEIYKVVLSGEQPAFWKELSERISAEERYSPRIVAEPIGREEGRQDARILIPEPRYLFDPLYQARSDLDLAWGKDSSTKCSAGHGIKLWEERCQVCGEKNPFAALFENKASLGRYISSVVQERVLKEIEAVQYSFIAAVNYLDVLKTEMGSEPRPQGEQESKNDYLHRIARETLDSYKRLNPGPVGGEIVESTKEASLKTSVVSWQHSNSIVNDLTEVWEDGVDTAIMARQNGRLERDYARVVQPIAQGLSSLGSYYSEALKAYAPVHKILNRDHSFNVLKFLWNAFRTYINPFGLILRIGIAAWKDDKEQKLFIDYAAKEEALVDRIKGLGVKIEEASERHNELTDTFKASLKRHIVRQLVARYHRVALSERPGFVRRVLENAGIWERPKSRKRSSTRSFVRFLVSLLLLSVIGASGVFLYSYFNEHKLLRDWGLIGHQKAVEADDGRRSEVAEEKEQGNTIQVLASALESPDNDFFKAREIVQELNKRGVPARTIAEAIGNRAGELFKSNRLEESENFWMLANVADAAWERPYFELARIYGRTRRPIKAAEQLETLRGIGSKEAWRLVDEAKKDWKVRRWKNKRLRRALGRPRGKEVRGEK